MARKTKFAVVLGAGFSKCADLPLAGEVSNFIFSEEFDSSLDKTITAAIGEFLKGAFYWERGGLIPSLEDIFTMIDLSANSGHNLGRKFTPKLLRAIRRILVYRIFQILDRNYRQSSAIHTFLEHCLPLLQEERIGFVVLNWDIVLERHLEIFPDVGIDYCIDALAWSGGKDNSSFKAKIAKVHGSSNWVYCDNCHSIFYDRYRKLSLEIKAGLNKADLRLFDEATTKKSYLKNMERSSTERDCRNCSCAVGPHIATFSFKKSFRTHAFANSWLAAEKILADASKWVFVGYSLPAADYEFKHLLKTCHLRFAKGKTPTKQIEVVLHDDEVAERNYRGFFGNYDVSFFQSGLENYRSHFQLT
jgi:hypothetical protein